MSLEYVVPVWCRMPSGEHKVAGGCWGISLGDVMAEGEQYCLNCEYYKSNVQDEPK